MSIAHKVIEAHRTSDVLIAENVDFDGLLLTDYVLKGLKNAGFRKPSPIQLKAIPLGRCGLDLVVQAKSGTGKTCVFAVIALESLLLDSSAVQVLVLAPTREIADQVWDVISKIGASIPSLRCQLFIGGMPLSADKKKAKVCHIAVGTPGRIKQLIEDGILKTTSIRLFILDEADKLLEESFQEQINWIYSALPENKQMLALSATYPEYLAQHLTQYMRNPTFIRLSKSDPALLGIKQYYKMVDFHSMAKQQFDNKTKAVMELLSNISFQQCLVFSNLQNRAHNLSDELLSQGWPTACIAGFLDQRDRNEAMAKLKTYKCRVLITTDLTARGIDAEKVNLIINLDVPKDHETYLHRIGRAGRFGSFGAAITLVSNGEEEKLLKILEYKCNTWIYPLPDPVPVDLVKINLPYKPKDVVITEQIITRPDLSQSETHKCEDQILVDNEEVDRSSAQESEVLIHLPSNDSTPNPNQLDMPATVCDKLEPDQLYDAYFNANDNVPINNRDDSVTPSVLVDKTFHLSLNSNVHLDKAFKIFVHADVQSSETEDKSGGHDVQLNENYSKSAHSDTALRSALVPAGAKLKQNKTNINHKVQDDDELFVGSRNDSSDVSLSRRNKLKKNVLNGRKTEDEDQNYVKSDGYDSFDQLFVSGEKSNSEQNRIRVDVSVPENWKLKCRTKQNTNVKGQISHNSDFISDELYDQENKDSNNLTNNSTENSKDKYKKKKQRSDDPNWRRVEKAEMVWRKDQDHTEPKTLHDSPARSSRSGCVLKIPSYQECIGYERVDCNITYTSAVESLDRFKQQGKLPEEKISLIDLIKTKITDSGKTEDKDLNALVSQHLNKFHREFNEKPEPNKTLSQRLPPSDLALKSVLKAPGKTRDKNMKNNPDSYDKNKIVSVTFSKTNQYVMSGLEQSSGQTDNLIYSDAMVQNLANLKLCGKRCPGDSSESQEGYESDSSSSFSSLYEKDVYKNSYAAEAERLQNKHEPGSSCNGEQVSEVSCDLEQKNSHSTFWSIGPYTDPKHPYHEDNLLMRAGDDGRGTVNRTEGSPNGIFSSHLISHSADAGQNTTRRQVHYPYGENPIIYPCGENPVQYPYGQNPDQYSDQENSNQYSDQENSSEYSTQENADELSAQQNPDEFSDEENSGQYPHQECSEQFSPQEIQDQTSSGENRCQENQDHFSPEEESFINQGKLPSNENQFSEVHYPYGEHPVMSSEEKSLCAEDELFYFKSVPPFRDPSYENMQQELNPYHQWDPNSPYTLSSQWVHYPPHPGLPLPNPYPGHGRFHYSPQNSFPTYPVQPDITCNYIPPQPGYAFPQEPLPRMSQQYEKVHQMLIQKQKEYIKHMSHW